MPVLRLPNRGFEEFPLRIAGTKAFEVYPTAPSHEAHKSLPEPSDREIAHHEEQEEASCGLVNTLVLVYVFAGAP